MIQMWLHFMITGQFCCNFETRLLRMSKQQQNVKKVQRTKKIRKTGWSEPKSSPAPKECLKAMLLAIL